MFSGMMLTSGITTSSVGSMLLRNPSPAPSKNPEPAQKVTGQGCRTDQNDVRLQTPLRKLLPSFKPANHVYHCLVSTLISCSHLLQPGKSSIEADSLPRALLKSQAITDRFFCLECGKSEEILAGGAAECDLPNPVALLAFAYRNTVSLNENIIMMSSRRTFQFSIKLNAHFGILITSVVSPCCWHGVII